MTANETMRATRENQIVRPDRLRGFWNKKHAKAGPCISRPDLVAERNDASQVTRYQVVIGLAFASSIACALNEKVCARRSQSDDNTCDHYPDPGYCVIRRSTGRVVFPEHGYESLDACDDWIAWGVAA